ncbi:Major Facilitator Superfamily protein [Actinacidiphila guanduensis]|uniref:Major Facilitator Superfamily protein n=1 Tax=Actinacidiphila guanduensis TaxID=310781 RepID=A0A1H0QES6_9ACTN|nr:MFS transporter [Actinacidiphila guanduensis]SDP15784.1 Major Facilitator Superfamily protein [Actinacidiphila guanduensis]
MLFLTRTLAIVADSLRITTFSVLVYAATTSPLLSGVAFGAGFLPQMVGTTLLGSLADRLPPRALITSGYLLECAAALLLALGPLSIGASLALVALVALLTPVFGGASARLVARWLTGDAYVLGRSLNNMASSGAQLGGLAIGGAAVSALGARHALLVGAGIYLAVAVRVRLGLPRLGIEPREGAAASPVRASLAATGTLLRAPRSRTLLLAQWLPGACVAGGEGLLVAYAGERGFAAGAYALLLACLPVGMLVGDFAVGRLAAPPTRERLVTPLVLLMGAPLVGFLFAPGVAVSAGLLLATGLGFSYALGLQRAFLDAVPASAQGHAFGLLASGTMTFQGVAPTLFGTLALLAPTSTALSAAGAATLLTAHWPHKALRMSRRAVPSARGAGPVT